MFFVEQTGVTEENFFASCVAEQENVKLSDGSDFKADDVKYTIGLLRNIDSIYSVPSLKKSLRN